ncbi:MAG: ATP-binding protein [Desulforhopalus sp.]
MLKYLLEKNMMRIDRKTAFKIMAILVMIFLVTILHYNTRQEEAVLHVIYRELYFLPIILAGFWFGLRGGPATALVITALYMPMVVGQPRGFAGHDMGNLLEVLLFNIIGILVGWLQDRTITHQTKRRKEEELTAIGRAVACVAHDMKTPLIAIGGLVRRIRQKIPEENRDTEKLDIVLQQTERLELMVKDMLVFAKPLDLNCQDDDFNKLFQETMLLAEEKARKHNVQLSLQILDDLSIYSFDYHRLQQALLNLINNAVEASQAEGKVIIRSKLDTNNIFIEVEDYGEGITADKIDEILHPFFSSKKEGTGLGLPIVKKIAEAHGGILQYKQQDGRGMVFRILLPIN